MAVTPDQAGMTPDQIYELAVQALRLKSDFVKVGLGAFAGIIAGIGGAKVAGNAAYKTKQLEHDYENSKTKKYNDLEDIKLAMEKVLSLKTELNDFMVIAGEHYEVKKNGDFSRLKDIKISNFKILNIKNELLLFSFLMDDSALHSLIVKYVNSVNDIITHFVDANNNKCELSIEALDLKTLEAKKDELLKKLSSVYRDLS